MLEGYRVVDADGHGGEPKDWHSRVPDAQRGNLTAYLARVEDHYRGLPASHRAASDAPRTAAAAASAARAAGHACRSVCPGWRLSRP